EPSRPHAPTLGSCVRSSRQRRARSSRCPKPARLAPLPRTTPANPRPAEWVDHAALPPRPRTAFVQVRRPTLLEVRAVLLAPGSYDDRELRSRREGLRQAEVAKAPGTLPEGERR